MSVQQRCPTDVPRQVRTEIFGESVVADVVDTTLVADAGGPRDVLTVRVGTSTYRVPADDCDEV